jgi:hypothetical protein
MQTDTTIAPLVYPPTADDIRDVAASLDSRLTVTSYGYPDDSVGLTIVTAPGLAGQTMALVFSRSFAGPHMLSCLMVLEPAGAAAWRTVTDLQAELRRLL